MKTKSKFQSINLAGWLFADMLLVLVIIFIGSEVRHSHNILPISDNAQNQTLEIVKEGVLEKDPREIEIRFLDRNGIIKNSPESITALYAELDLNKDYVSFVKTNRYAAVVSVFTSIPNKDLSLATRTSEAICNALIVRGSLMDTNTKCFSGGDGTLDPNQVKIRLFLVVPNE